MRGGEQSRSGRHVSCSEVRERIQTFLDQEMNDQQMEVRFAAHLDFCQSCCEEARTFSDLKDCLSRMLPPLDPAAIRRLEEFVGSLGETEPGTTFE